MNHHPALALAALTLGALLQPVAAVADPPAHARNENSAQHRGYEQSRNRYDDERGDYDDRRRYSDDHHPRRGYVVQRLPHGARVVHHHGHRYYYSRGAWYRPHGPRYVVIDPPMGPVYYVWNPRARGYLVTDQRYRW
jgi:hypothetical protein